MRTLVVLVLLAAVGTPTLAATYEIDPVHSSVNFQIRHMRVGIVTGRFNEFSGTIVFDEADLSACSVEMTVKSASVDTANAKRDEHLRSADYFDADKHPEITFRSTAWKRTARGTYEVTGNLSLHGVTRPVTAVVQHLGTVPGRKGRDLAGFLARLTIRRSEFGMTNALGPVGEEVELEIAVEAIERPRSEAAEATAPPAANRMADDRAPTPFSAEEIRRGCPAGRTSIHRLEFDGKPPIIQRIRYLSSDEEGTEFEVKRSTVEGTPIGKPGTMRDTWKQMQGHASYPAEGTVITTEHVVTPAGAFDCWLYTVTSGVGRERSVVRAWFAKSLAGPPVKMTRHVDGKLAATMVVVEHRMEPESWDVLLTATGKDRKILVIALVRKVTGMKLRDTWEHVDYLELGPVVVRRNLSLEEADALIGRIAEARGKARRVPGSGPPRPLANPELPPYPIEGGPVDVVLKMVDNKIRVLRELRAITGLGLAEVTALVDGLPATIRTGMDLEEAKALKERLQKAGAIVRFRPSDR